MAFDGPAPCSSTGAGRGARLLLLTEVDGECVAVVARGELSHDTADELAVLVRRAAAEAGVATVAVDTLEVDFIDSSGVSALLASRSTCVAAGVVLRLRRSKAVHDKLSRTGLGQLFPE